MCHDSHWACTLDSDLQMRDDNSVSVCVISTFLATFSVPLLHRLTLSAWLAVSPVRHVSLFTPVTVTGHCRSPAISSVQVSPTVAASCITSCPRHAMPAFPYTQAMLQPHPGLITTHKGRILEKYRISGDTKGATLDTWQPYTVLNLHHPHWKHWLLVSPVASCF